MSSLRRGDELKIIKNRTSLLFLACIIGGAFFLLRLLPPKEIAISKILSKIPLEEKWFLDYFFRTLLLKDSGAFVLNGTKPAGCSDFLGPQYHQYTIHWRGYNKSTLFRKGYETWKKYEHLFPSTSFCFSYYEDTDDDLIDVTLINKSLFLKAISDNIEDFKAVLGSDITPEILLEKIISKQAPLEKVLNHHPCLIGIVLGFGKHNSSLFYRRSLLEKEFNLKKQDLIEQEVDKLKEKQQFSDCKSDILLFSSLPRFAFDPTHPETQELHNKYTQQRKKFTNLHQHGTFLEVTLKNLVSEN